MIADFTTTYPIMSEYCKLVVIESRGSEWIVGTKASACSELVLVRT